MEEQDNPNEALLQTSAFYVEASRRNEKEPLWKLLRESVSKVDERMLQEIKERLPIEGETN